MGQNKDIKLVYQIVTVINRKGKTVGQQSDM